MNSYNPFSLEGRTILVTGASSGIGRTTAEECAKLGAKVIITGRNTERLQETFNLLTGGEHQQIAADLSSESDIERLTELCPSLDGAVLCAGIGKTLPLGFSTKNEFAEVFNVNFNASVEITRILLKKKKIAAGGSVVFVSSIAGHRGGTSPGNAIYAASKAALDTAMRHFACEYGYRKIRFNTVCPGVVNTPFVKAVQDKMSPEQIAADIARYPLGRHGEPIDIAHGISYLLSGASSWVTGHQLVIDGGATI